MKIFLKDKKIEPCKDDKHNWVTQPEVCIHDPVCDKCGICASELEFKGTLYTYKEILNSNQVEK